MDLCCNSWPHPHLQGKHLRWTLGPAGKGQEPKLLSVAGLAHIDYRPSSGLSENKGRGIFRHNRSLEHIMPYGRMAEEVS